MVDLSAMSAFTNNEFALFTKGNSRIVVRGNINSVPIDAKEAKILKSQGYKWSGHTHPTASDNAKIASDGDYKILDAFDQNRSVIYDSLGRYELFWRR